MEYDLRVVRRALCTGLITVPGAGAVMNWAVFAMGRGVCDGGGGGRRTGKEGKESCGS